MTKDEALNAQRTGALVQTWSGAVGKVGEITENYVIHHGTDYKFMIRLYDPETGNDLGSWVPDAVKYEPLTKHSREERS